LKSLSSRTLKTFFVITIVLLVVVMPIEFSLSPLAESFRSVTLIVPAVVTLQNGTEVGVTARLTVYTAPGHGVVYIATNPIAGTDTEATARIAFLVATYLANVNPYSVDAYISFNTSSLMIEGPSAGVAMTVAILASLRGDHIKRDVIATGMVNPDGTVGPVGGLLAKLEAAARSGAKYFLIPMGQRYTYTIKVVQKQVGPITITKEERVPVDLYKVGKSLGVKVVEVSTIREAYKYFTGIELPFNTTTIPSLLPCLERLLMNSTQHYIKVAFDNINNVIRLESLLNSVEKKYVESVVNNIKGLINESKRYSDLPYVSASKAFQAAIESTYLLYVVYVLTGVSPKTLIENVTKSAEAVINATRPLIKGLPNNYEGLEIRIAVATRLQMAEEAITKALELLQSNQILDNALTGEWGALHEAAYAYWRAVSAEDWAKALTCFESPSANMSYSALKGLAEFALYYGSSVISYATSLLKAAGAPLTSLSTANNYYNKAYELFEKGDIYCSIGYFLEAIAYGIVTIDSTFISNISQMLNVAKMEAYDALNRLLITGITPPLSLSYLQFAMAQNNPVSKLYYYELSSSYMKVLYYVSGLSLPAHTNKTAESNVTVVPLNATHGKNQNVTQKELTTEHSNGTYLALSFIMLILGLAIGMVIGRVTKE